MIRSRTAGIDRVGLIDAVVIILGTGSLIWTLSIASQLTSATSVPGQLVSIAYPLADLVLLSIIVGISLSGKRTVAGILLCVALSGQLLADTAYALTSLSGTFFFGSAIFSGWFVSFVALGACVLHPSVAELGSVSARSDDVVSRRRLMFMTAAGITPLILLITHADDPKEFLVVGVVVVAVLIMTLVRLSITLGTLTRSRNLLRRRDAAHSSLISGVRDHAIFLLDAEGRVMTWNAAATAMTGYTESEIVGQDFSSFYLPDEVGTGAPRKLLEAAVEEGKVDTQGWRLRADGTKYWCEVALSAVRDTDGSLFGFAKVARDTTEQRSLERQLRQAEKMRAVGQLAGGIAHDFNNLLAVILNYTQFLRDDDSLSSKAHEDLDEVLAAGHRGATLVKQLLTMSRQEDVMPEAIEVQESLKELEKFLVRTLGEDIDLVMKAEGEPASVLIDPGQLNQIIMNLAVNARDAMPHGGRLIVEARVTRLESDVLAQDLDLRPGDYVCLSISDTGKGISAEVQEHIFEPFYTTKGRSGGTGLGLATVYGIVEQAGGRITVSSEEGLGATF
ncbi:MAG: PAS domain S-box protein, partial [Actinobacteria bacterium]|nr:PAS domain S-box protein [Actinomycetota bacterium]